MITEDYVSFETAKLLKEKGFNEFIRCWYDNFQDFHEEGTRMSNTDCLPPTIMCPTFQMAMKWLREVHKIDIIAPPQYDSIRWTYSAIIFKLSILCTEIRLNDNKDKKEETCEAAIKYCLENLI